LFTAAMPLYPNSVRKWARLFEVYEIRIV
jgi:hypothetical protein